MNWFRFYHEALDDPKVQRLPGDLYKAWVNILCLASRNGKRGYLPAAEDVGFALRTSTEAAQSIIDELRTFGLIDNTDDGLQPHNWPERQRPSDTSNDRVARHRAKNKDNNEGNVTGNVTETEEKRYGNALEKSREEENRKEQNNDVPDGTDDAKRFEVIDGGIKPKPKPKYSAEFESFWLAYPSGHGNKARSYEQWRRIKPDEDLRREIMTGLDAWKRCDRWRNGYVKAAEVWLKDSWWEDDPPPAIEAETESLSVRPGATEEELRASMRASIRMMG